MGTLAGKVAVVTGGASGIGLATATRLAGAGATVAVVDLDGEAAQRAATSLGGMAVCADVGRSDQWTSTVEEVTTRLGGIDLAHLNAGVTTGEADITALTDDAYRRVVGANLDGVVFGVRALVPVLSERGGGAMVVTASLAGLIGFSPDPLYCVTKHAVVGLVRSLTPQLAARNITLNAVCPGIVDTPLVAGARPLLEEAGFPLIEPSAVAEAVVGALSGEDSGEALVVQAGRKPLAFRFGRPPGPRHGRRPPDALTAHDQG